MAFAGYQNAENTFKGINTFAGRLFSCPNTQYPLQSPDTKSTLTLFGQEFIQSCDFTLSQHSLQDIRNRDDFVVSSLETNVWIRASLNEYLEQFVNVGLVRIATTCGIVALLQKQTPDSLPVIDVYALIRIRALF